MEKAKLLVRLAVDALLKDIESNYDSIEEYHRLINHLEAHCPRLLTATIKLEGNNLLTLGLVGMLNRIPTSNSKIFYLSVRSTLESALIEAITNGEDDFFYV